MKKFKNGCCEDDLFQKNSVAKAQTHKNSTSVEIALLPQKQCHLPLQGLTQMSFLSLITFYFGLRKLTAV